MDAIRGYIYRLKPTEAQAADFRKTAGVCRLIYNAALEQRSRYGERYKLNASTVSRELKNVRAEFDWIAAVAQTAQAQALRDLDKAFQNFFAGRAGFPTPRRKGVNDSFRYCGREISLRRINHRWSEVKLPKIGWVRFRDTRKIVGEIRNATVSLTALGWHISFAIRVQIEEQAPLSASVGIDRGIANTLTLSTGERLSLPDSLKRIERRKRRAQRTLSRRRRGSKRRLKSMKRVAALAARAARIRKDWNHKASLNIAQRFGAVVLEDLKISNMSASAKGTVGAPGKNVRQKAGLNRSILNQGWFQFETFLAYKLEERGGDLVKVNPAYTSQTCSSCGCIDKRSRESQAGFVCVECGHEVHADTNAAVNILRRANGPLLRVEDGREAA